MENNRVMFIVLDGAPFDVLFPLAQENILPNFRMLIDKGCFNLLHSTIPPFSPVAMPSLFSGKNPGKHGIFGFGRVEKGLFKPYLSTSMPEGTLWDILSSINKKVILLNVPWTFPPFKVNGIMISGPPIPGNRAKSYPSNLISILESKIGHYPPDLNLDLGAHENVGYIGLDQKSFLHEAYLVTRRRAEAMYYLMKNYEWEFFLVVFTTLDRMQHVFFGYFDEESPLFDSEKREYLTNYFKEIDSIIGKVASLLNENDYLIIASDHGFEYVHKYVGINNLLVNGNFAKKRSDRQVFTIEKIFNFIEKIGIKDYTKFVPMKIAQFAGRVLPRDLDYARSRAFGVPAGYVSINKGALKNDSKYEVFKKALVDFFYSIRDESSGEKIVEKIYDTREIYHGDHTSDAPDLVIAFKRGYEPNLWRNDAIEQVRPIEKKTVRTGSHSGLLAQRGILVISGNGIKEKFRSEANIVDVAPTILHISGIPIPRDIDGRVLKEVFKPETKFSQRSTTYDELSHEKEKSKYKISRKDEAEIVDKLKKLGYI